MIPFHENFNRKLEKISEFLSEALGECCKNYGKISEFEEFLSSHPSLLKQTLQNLCNKILSSILHSTKINYSIDLNNKENERNASIDIFDFNLSLDIEKSKKNSLDNQDKPDFNLLKMFVKQYKHNREREFEDLNWKVENYKNFMDDKTQRIFEMVHLPPQKENSFNFQNIKQETKGDLYNKIKNKFENEKQDLLSQINSLKKQIVKKDAEISVKDRVLKQKDEAILLKSLANNYKEREIFSMSKKIGEKDLLLLLQSKSHHQPSKSFSNNLY